MPTFIHSKIRFRLPTTGRVDLKVASWSTVPLLFSGFWSDEVTSSGMRRYLDKGVAMKAAGRSSQAMRLWWRSLCGLFRGLDRLMGIAEREMYRNICLSC